MQIVVHMVKYADEFMGILDKFLEQRNLNLGFIDYVFGVAHGDIWGDEYMIAVISHMWNISISMMSPGYSMAWKIFHNREPAHIYVIGNRYRFQARQKATHFRAMESILQLARKVCYDIDDANIHSRNTYQQGRIAGTIRYLPVKRVSSQKTL